MSDLSSVAISALSQYLLSARIIDLVSCLCLDAAFDWTDSRWHSYLDSLYPRPPQSQILKWKKKWFKSTVDADFDTNSTVGDTASATAAARSESNNSSESAPSAARGTAGTASNAQHYQGQFGAPPAPKTYLQCKYPRLILPAVAFLSVATVMFILYVIGAAAIWRQSTVCFIFGFALDVICRYGIPELNNDWWMPVVFDDSVQMVLMLGMLLMCSLTASPMPAPAAAVSALLCLHSVATAYPFLQQYLPARAKPLYQRALGWTATNKPQMLQWRAQLEVIGGVLPVLTGIVGLVRGRFMLVVNIWLYWTWLRLRYMTNNYTQTTFRMIDTTARQYLPPSLLVYYQKASLWLYSYVDPAQQRR
eukprot:Filipodium_phascolosomae@DN524_c0_g1_i1.p1